MDPKRFVVSLFFLLLSVMPTTALNKLLVKEGTFAPHSEETDAIVTKDNAHVSSPQTVRGICLGVYRTHVFVDI